MTGTRLAGVLARRGTHRSRSTAVSVALGVVALVALAIAALAVLPAFGLRLPVTPASVIETLATEQGIAIAAGAALAVLGIVAIVAAVSPGARARHRIRDERAVLLVDDDVLAGAVSGRIAREAGMAPEQVTTSVGSRSVSSRIRPTSGHPVDRDRMSRSVREYVDALAPHRPMRTRVTVESTGTVTS